ncbi:MAG: tetraacyldisaccharide 4'-kinase [Candidatus Brocadiales bacterium]
MTTLTGLYPLSEENAVVQRLRRLYLSIIREEKKGLLPSLVLSVLSVLSCFYYVLFRLRELLYRFGVLKSVSLPVPVISIGNITTGGTGKTPLLELVTKFLIDRGKKVAILSRGYAGMKIGENQVNDEYLEFAERLPDVPVLLGKDRLSSARTALEDLGADCLLLDDGFQHWRLARDLDIVVIDGLEPFGNGGLIPAGILREPLNNLCRAHLLILSHTDLCGPTEIEAIEKRLAEIDYHKPVLESVHHPLHLEDMTGARREIPWLRGKRIYAFCGLGNPGSLEKTLAHTGADVVTFKDFPDHHHYSTNELVTIDDEASRLGADAVVTTQKDLVKIKNMDTRAWNTPILSLRVEMRITNGLDILSEKLEKVLS